MTVAASSGPLITIGSEPPLGTANQAVGVAGVGPYISGTAENPDAGPNCFFAGNMFKDPLYRYKRGSGPTAAGGYPNQSVGFVDHEIQTLDFAPSQISTVNLAALQGSTIATPMTLVAASGAGVFVTTVAVTVLNTGLIVPTGMRRIDADPAWVSVSQASSAMKAWSRAACGRAISMTSAGGQNLSAVNYTFRGYDIYGRPQTETIAGPNGSTVNGKKGWKWIASVTPSASNAAQCSIGTTDIFEFPIRADKFAQVTIYWNDTLITAVTGFVAPDATSPATASTGSPRGTYALQVASDGTKQLQVFQRIAPANLLTSLGVYGVDPV